MKYLYTFLYALLAFISISLVGCNKIDNYMLGKDNTPPPASLIPFSPELDVKQLWEVNAGKGTKGSYLEMFPTVYGDSVYTADLKGDVMAFNRATGEKRWTTHLDTDLISGPAVGENIVAVTNKEAQIIVLDSHTGEKRWKRTVSNEVLAVPTIAEDKVFVKTVDGKLYAFNQADGKRAWIYDHGTTTLVMRAGSSPQVFFGFVLAGFSDGKLVGLRADTGQVLWEKTMAIPDGVSDVERITDIDTNPIVMDGTAYVAAYQQNISALSLQTGEILWQKKDLSTLNNMAANQTTLYIVDSESTVWALERDSGTVLWQQKAFHNRHLTASAIVDDKALVLGDLQGFVQWLSLTTGEPIARTRPARSPIDAQPTVDTNNVYILTSYGKLVAYQVN